MRANKAQCIECLFGVRKVMGLIPIEDSDFLFVPCLGNDEDSIFHLNLAKSLP